MLVSYQPFIFKYGINISEMMSTDLATVMIADVIYARVSFWTFLIGLIPGVIANVMGAAIAGRLSLNELHRSYLRS